MNTAGAETAIVSCGGDDAIEIAMERDTNGRATKRAQRCQRVLDLHESGNNGMDDVSVDEYVRMRLQRKLEHYRNRARWLHFQVKVLEYAGYILTGLCTALILVDEEVWVAALIVLVNMTANVAAVGMLEDRLVRTNDAIVKLDNLSSWWRTLEEEKQISQAYMHKCVETVESIIMCITVGALPLSENEIPSAQR